MSIAKVKDTGEIIEVKLAQYVMEDPYVHYCFEEVGGFRCFDNEDLEVPSKSEIEEFLSKKMCNT